MRMIYGDKRQKYIRIKNTISVLVIEGFLLYGVLSTACEETWPSTAGYWRAWLHFLYVLVLLTILLQKNSWTEWLVIMGLLGLAGLTRITTQTDAVLWFVAGTLAAKDMDLRIILKGDLAVRAIAGVCLIVLPLLGLYPNYADQMIGMRLRSSFGWPHPNEMGLFFLMICVSWMYFRHSRWNWKDTMGMIGLVIFLDYFANSRTSELCIVLIVLLEGIVFIWKKAIEKENVRIRFWTCCSVLALFGGCLLTFILIITVKPGREWLGWLPGTVSGRLILAHNFWAAEGFSLFGQIFNYEQFVYLDMMYAYLSLNMGIIVLVCFIALNCVTVWTAYRKKDEKLLLMLLVLLIYSMLEHEHFKILSGYYPVVLGYGLWTACRWKREVTD